MKEMTLIEAHNRALFLRKIIGLTSGERAAVILDDRITELEDCLKWYADEQGNNYCNLENPGCKARRMLEKGKMQ